jgi:hypothetical protein
VTLAPITGALADARDNLRPVLRIASAILGPDRHHSPSRTSQLPIASASRSAWSVMDCSSLKVIIECASYGLLFSAGHALQNVAVVFYAAAIHASKMTSGVVFA